MSSRPVLRARPRVLALGLAALLAAGSLSLTPAVSATAAETDSSVTVPIGDVGTVTISKTRDLADGEEITVSGRVRSDAVSDRYAIGQAGTNYSPAGGGENAIRVHEGELTLADLTADPADDAYKVFSVQHPVHATLTSRADGTQLDARSHQSYLTIGGSYSGAYTPEGEVYYVPIVQEVADPVYSTRLIPLTFEGGASELTVDTPVVVTANPASVVAEIGETVSFEGAATGDPAPALQWQVSEDNGEGWEAIPGETSETLTRGITLADDGLQFRLRVSNRISVAYSAPAVLSVNVPEEEPVPYDPTKATLVSDGSWVQATPLTGLVDGQQISIDANYSLITENYLDNSPYPHLPVVQTSSATTQEPTESRPALLLGVADGSAYSASGTYTVSRSLTAADGTVTDCLVTQCYLAVGGTLYAEDWSGLATDPAATGGYISLGHPTIDSSNDVATTRRFPIFFEGTELTPPAAPERELPAYTTQPADASVVSGYAAQFEIEVTGSPEPTFQWQRSVDGGESWQTIRGETLSSIRIATSIDLNGYQYRVRATNEVGTVYSDAATLTVTPGSDDGNNPGADITRKGVSLDWVGSPELQRRSPAYTPNYYSAGVSEGTKATYKNVEGDTAIVFRSKTGAETATTFETTFAHLPATPSLPPTGDEQLVRLNNGVVTRDDDGGASVSWDATWTINFYGGLVPFTLSNPVLSWDAHGTGTLTADLSGYGSSMENPEVKVPLEPVLGATISTFSNATIDAEGTFTATPDYAGVEVTAPDGVAPQDRTVEGWGSWPQQFVDFQFETGLSSYWYSSGGSADAYKAPSPITVSGLYDLQIDPETAPAAPAKPVATATSGTAIDVAWEAPVDGGSAITGYTVTVARGGETVQTVEVDGAAPSTAVDGLEPGVEYAVTVTATNAVGTSPASEAAVVTTHGPPAAPAAPQLAAGEGASLVASWTAPASDGGSPVTGYDVVLRSGDEVVETRTVEGTETTFEQLTRGTAYTATVAARNALGVSAASEASAAVTVAPLAPAAPAAPAVTPGVGTLAVAWAVPAHNGSPVTGYTVTATPVLAGAGEQVAVDTTDAAATLTGLARGTEYRVSVIARNAVGASEPSAATRATTLAEAPAALAAPTVTAVSDSELGIAWTAPADDGGSPVTGYVVTVLRDGAVVATADAAADASAITVGDLERGTAYTATVAAVNAAGTGASSPASAPVSTLDVPGAPASVTAALAGSDGVTVSWTAPASDGGSPVTGYVVTLTAGDAVLATREVAGTSVEVGGLAPGTTVVASVVAVNAVGASPAASSGEVRVPAAAPDAPAAPTLSAGGVSELLVGWAPPAGDGGSPVTAYRVVLAGPDGTDEQTVDAGVRTARFTGVAAGSYTAAVIAVNEAGASEPSAASAVVDVPGAEPAQPELLGEGDLADDAWGVPVEVADGVITVRAGADHAGRWIGVSVHSDPVFVGWVLADAQGVATATVPAGLDAGVHHAVAYGADGAAIGYAAFTVGDGGGTTPGTGGGATAPGTGSGSGTTSGDGAGSGDGSAAGTRAGALPATGSDAGALWPLAGLGFLVLAAGAALVIRRAARTDA